MKYQAVIFDLFGTLIFNVPNSEDGAVKMRMAEELGIPVDEFNKLWHDTYDKRIRGIYKNYQECLDDMCRQAKVKCSKVKLDRAAGIRLQMAKKEVLTPVDGAMEVMAELKKKGLKTGLLSDCSMETTILWQSSTLASYIDEPVFSCREGMRKPDDRLFRLASERLGVSPEKCVYIADGMSGELAAATGLGMHAVKISVPGKNEPSEFSEEWTGHQIASLDEVLDIVK
jgi:putative hydrolase of the HAD superfamily